MQKAFDRTFMYSNGSQIIGLTEIHNGLNKKIFGKIIDSSFVTGKYKVNWGFILHSKTNRIVSKGHRNQMKELPSAKTRTI